MVDFTGNVVKTHSDMGNILFHTPEIIPDEFQSLDPSGHTGSLFNPKQKGRQDDTYAAEKPNYH